MKIGDAEQYIKKALQDIYEEGERNRITEILLEEYIGKPRSYLLFHKDELLTSVQEEIIKSSVKRLVAHEPVQYVINKAWFYGMELYVDKGVLIPRPETEELVAWMVADINAEGIPVFERNVTTADATNSLKILDVGTGSGCIALALKKELPKAEVWGCDISDEALNVARRNGAALDIRVDFQGVNFLDEAAQQSLPPVHVLVSNPPYIPLRDKATMQPNVLAYEPHTALFVPDDDALLFYKAIAAFAKKKLLKKGKIYLEIHEDLGQQVTGLYRQEGFSEVVLKKDMQGKERMVKVSV